MSQFIKFYFTSSMLNMFRTLIHPSSGACDFSITTLVVCSCFDVCWSFGVAGWGSFGVAGWGGIRVVGWSCASSCHTDTTLTSHTETPTHIETRTHNQCGDTVEKSQAPDDGCINVRNMLSIEEVKWNLINFDIKLVSYSSTRTPRCWLYCILLYV